MVDLWWIGGFMGLVDLWWIYGVGGLMVDLW